MKMIDIKNKKEFINYMKKYGWHVSHYIGDYYSIGKSGDCHFHITKYEEKHRKNWYNTSPFEKTEASIDECLELISKAREKAQRKDKLIKLSEYDRV